MQIYFTGKKDWEATVWDTAEGDPISWGIKLLLQKKLLGTGVQISFQAVVCHTEVVKTDGSFTNRAISSRCPFHISHKSEGELSKV